MGLFQNSQTANLKTKQSCLLANIKTIGKENASKLFLTDSLHMSIIVLENKVPQVRHTQKPVIQTPYCTDQILSFADSEVCVPYLKD
jgi:hypothetical protein